MLVVNISKATWWQTPIAFLVAIVIFIPMVFATGFLFLVFWPSGEGLSGEIDFITRGIQYAAAAGLAVYVPHKKLSRSNPVVVAVGLAAVFSIWPMLIRWDLNWYGWLETIASVVGIICGALLGAESAKELIHKQ